MIFLATLVCAAGMALLVYRYDMYDREPWYMLLLAAALGAAGFWVLSYGEDMLLDRWFAGHRSLAAVAGVAGVCEELCKLLIVGAIWCLIPRHFNDPFDGLIYGAMAGLGFALAESMFYTDLMGAGLPPASLAGQEVVRLILHLLMGALTCVGLGLARFRVKHWPRLLVGSLAASILLHTAWDYFCGLPSLGEAALIQQRAIAVALMLAAMLLFGAAVVVAVRHSAESLRVRRLRDLWGWPFS
jgi:RsiW-degrading membrane proteinase PrsW (M82 family)